MERFKDIFKDCTSQGRKIPKEDYLSEGKYIVVDQGQNVVAGYTDLEEGLFEDVPAIVFGDHTRIVKYVDKPFFLGADGVKLLKAKRSDANYKYLYYALRNAKIPNTGYNRHYKWLKEIKLEYPNNNRQQEIVQILDKVTKVIQKRRQEIDRLDEFIKARFVEMFGDPVTNPKGWHYQTMKSVCTKITDGEHGSVARVEEGHPFLNAKHIKASGDIDWNTVTFTSDEVHKRIYKRCNPEGGDIVMTTTGTIGNVAVVPENREPFTMDRGITLLKLDTGKVQPLYIAWLLRQEAIQNIMNSNVHASAIGHLFLNKVEEIPVMLPDMKSQMGFAAFVAQVDKSKFHDYINVFTISMYKRQLIRG